MTFSEDARMLASKSQGWAISTLVVASLWLGLLLGVSFLATPAKFLAPSLSLPVALDVGRHTFAVFNKAEWLLSVLLLSLVVVGIRSRISCVAAFTVALLTLTETVWLLPILDQHAGLVIAGQQPVASNYHSLYFAIEIAKVIALVLVVFLLARRLLRLLPNHLSSDSCRTEIINAS
jgi:hypothetical protein